MGAAGSAPDQFAAQLVHRILKASDDLDPVALQAQLDLSAAVIGLRRCIDEVVMPAGRQLRGLPASEPRNVNRELLATEAIRAWLNLRLSFAPAPRDIGPILLASGSRESPVVGRESMALLLRFQRWPCQLLGTRVSTFTLTIAAQAADPVGVVIFCSERRGLSRAVVLLRAVDALGVPVFFAGDAFDSPRSREQVPGRYLGVHIEGACSLLRSVLGPLVRGNSASRLPSMTAAELVSDRTVRRDANDSPAPG